MSDFKVIETQEQFDAAIGERIKRERESLGKKYEGYISPEDFNSKKTDYDTMIGNLNKKLEEANKKIANHDKEIADRDKRIKAYETDSVKTRIAHEIGLSFEAIEFLRGEDEEAIRKSAESLKGLVGTRKVAPLASTEHSMGNSKDAALRQMVKNLSKGE